MGKSSRLILATVLVVSRVFCLRLLVVHLAFPCASKVEAVTFAFSGFKENSLQVVPNSSWISNTTTGCFNLDPREIRSKLIASGRLLYPFPVQMIEPGSTTVKSWSTTFIFQLQILAENGYNTGPGMAFCMVPDNITVGGSGDFMGLITSETSETAKNYESDNHTVGVELDTYRNSVFNDTNNNHIGINSASMNSTYSFKPPHSLVSSGAILYQQMWIDYVEAESRMEIYIANYKEGKPAKPQGSQSGLNLSLMLENMFIGFSSAYKVGSGTLPHVCAWSFSNDGIPAPPIVIAHDATPSGVPSHRPDGELATTKKKGGSTIKVVGILVGVIVSGRLLLGLCILISWRQRVFPSRPRPQRMSRRVFLSHAGGPDESGKNFAKSLYDTMVAYKWSSSALFDITFFFDRESINYGEFFPEQIFAELARSDVLLVVVTDDFFRGRWPMTELLTFKDALKKDTTGRLRALPLFYKLEPKEVRRRSEDRISDDRWELAWERNHPDKVEECRAAVNWLCSIRGIVYRYIQRGYDREYAEDVCEVLDEVLLPKPREKLGLIRPMCSK